MAVNANVKWADGLQFVARAGDGPAVVLDTHDGGGGPSPMEMVLIGAAGCTAMDVISIMKKKRVVIDRFEVTIDGDQAEEYPKRYTAIRITYIIYGQGIKSKAMEQAIELSKNKYCSVTASLNADVAYTYEIKEP
ncbi:MAG: OsmC family protein [Thermodesulfobacteriota bacterium]